MASYRQYRAPREDDAALIDPSPARLGELIANAKPWSGQATFGDWPLERLRREARGQLLSAAHAHTSAYADVATPRADCRIVLSGHQPELFHPGVWFKNVALDALAESTGVVGVHLLIDSDTCTSTTVRVPVGPIDRPRLEAVPFDALAPAVPYEHRGVRDGAVWGSFAERLRGAVEPFVDDPILEHLWPAAIGSARRTDRVGLAISEARHRYELARGGRTLEAPISVVADAEPFRRFVAELLLRADETRSAYNAALADYRVAHRVRNAAQPLPDLNTEDGWIETPLWVSSEAAPTRRAVYTRIVDNRIELSDRVDWRAEAEANADGVVERLAAERARGVRLRSRALVTTLYARLVLSDLFLHGIGGAKYDQVTDRFSQRLLGDSPPEHATLTATLRLPTAYPAPTDAEQAAAPRLQRELVYHPERHAPDTPSAAFAEAAVAKRRWINTPKTPANAAERHRAIVEANRAMSNRLAANKLAAEESLARLKQQRDAAAVLGSREFPFCLFPNEDTHERLVKLSSPLRASKPAS